MTKEHIEIIRQSLIPFVKKELLEINNDGLGESYAKEFEKDLNEVLDLAIKALEQEPCEDCVSRAEAIKELKESAEHHANDTREEVLLRRDRDIIRALPPVTPTQCIAAVRFSKDDLREVCNERIEIECTHGTCKDCTNYVVGALDEEICLRGHELICKDFYCADFEKRGNENGTDNTLSMR